MSASTAVQGREQGLDIGLLVAFTSLLALGLVLVGSASFGIAEKLTGNPFYFLIRQSGYVAGGLLLMWTIGRIPAQVIAVSYTHLTLPTIYSV